MEALQKLELEEIGEEEEIEDDEEDNSSHDDTRDSVVSKSQVFGWRNKTETQIQSY